MCNSYWGDNDTGDSFHLCLLKPQCIRTNVQDSLLLMHQWLTRRLEYSSWGINALSFDQVVGGNVAIAILLTLGGNLAGIFTIPFTLPLVIGSATFGRVSLSSMTLLIQMIQTVLLPTLLGYMVRESSRGNGLLRNCVWKSLLHCVVVY